MKKAELKQAILEYMQVRPEETVFLRTDFQHLDTYQKVGRAISELCAQERAIRIGHGLYCRTRVTRFSDKPIPDIKDFTQMANRALTRLGYQVTHTTAAIDNFERRSTQVPNGRQVGLRGKQTKRKIGYFGTYVNYQITDSLDDKYNISSNLVKL